MQPSGDIEEGRSARTAVQELVAAADGEVGIHVRQVHRHGARRMRQVPYHERAGLVGSNGQRRHVEHPAGAIVYVRQHDHGYIRVQRCLDFVNGDRVQLVTAGEQGNQTFGNVKVSGEITGF